MKIILFGFTGLGNAVLRGLLKIKDVDVISVFTKKYYHLYPFYEEIQIEELCKLNKIKCYNDVRINNEGFELIKKDAPDLIIVSSFNQIISKEVIVIPNAGIVNVHTSLLPKYRGPYPDQAVLLKGETETGVTIHYLTEKLDSGNILLQQKIKIEETDNYCSLKKKLAEVSEKLMKDLITLFQNNKRPEGEKQNENEATFYPKPTVEDGFLENEINIDKIKNKIRALNPFPGTSFLFNDKRINISDYKLLGRNEIDDGVYEYNDFLDFYKNDFGIRLFKNK